MSFFILFSISLSQVVIGFKYHLNALDSSGLIGLLRVQIHESGEFRNMLIYHRWVRPPFGTATLLRSQKQVQPFHIAMPWPGKRYYEQPIEELTAWEGVDSRWSGFNSESRTINWISDFEFSFIESGDAVGHHGVGNFDEARNIRAFDVVGIFVVDATGPIAFVVYVFHDLFQFFVDFDSRP